MSMVSWLPIPRFAGDYEVSSIGQIRRATPGKTGGTHVGRLRKLTVDALGYFRVPIRDPQTQRYRLVSPHIAVLEAFVGPRPEGCDASHMNGVRTDNRLENLCWETSSENHRRKLAHGTFVHGEKHKCSKLKVEQVEDIRRRVAAGERQAELAREYDVSKSNVSKIVHFKAWPHMAVLG